ESRRYALATKTSPPNCPPSSQKSARHREEHDREHRHQDAAKRSPKGPKLSGRAPGSPQAYDDRPFGSAAETSSVSDREGDMASSRSRREWNLRYWNIAAARLLSAR